MSTGNSLKNQTPNDLYEVLIERKAHKHLEKLDESSKMRILEALRILRDAGFVARLDLKKLRGYENHYRLRVGEYRVLFELQKPRKIIVYAILPRRAAYKRRDDQ